MINFDIEQILNKLKTKRYVTRDEVNEFEKPKEDKAVDDLLDDESFESLMTITEKKEKLKKSSKDITEPILEEAELEKVFKERQLDLARDISRKE